MVTRQSARKALEERLRWGRVWSGPLPETLKLSEIETLEGVFQYRSPQPHKGKEHIRRLGRSVKRQGKALGRLLVYWVGDGWVCVDGHHRLTAYQLQTLEDVPVEVFIGEPHEAVEQALLRNTEDKLPVEEPERTAAAWGLVTTWNEVFSKPKIAGMAGVSTSVVANMRVVFNQLTAERPGLDLSSLTWKEARELAKGTQVRGGGDEDKLMTLIKDKLIKAGIPAHLKRLDLVVKAFREIDEDSPAGLRDAIEDMEANEADGDTEGALGEAHHLPFPETSGTPKVEQAADF